MRTYRRLLGSAGCSLALGIFMAAPACFGQVDQPAQSNGSQLIAAEAPALNLSAPAASYSSSSSSLDELSDARLNLSSAAMDAAQPPPRRRYGRPNYSDSHTNADGSSKFAFMAGGGAAVPTMDTANYLTPSWTFQAGAGRNWNKNFGVLFQFDYAHFGMQGPVLYNQYNLYNSFCTTAQAAAGNCTPLTSLDGNSHIWSFTLDPTYTIYTSNSGRTGAYVVGGVGFYHKVANFTVPTVGSYCDYFYGCYQYQVNQNIDHYTSNAFGLNGGVGLTYKLSHFASERLYMEARFVWIDNQPRSFSYTNLYPPNANQSYYIPITVGLRF